VVAKRKGEAKALEPLLKTDKARARVTEEAKGDFKFEMALLTSSRIRDGGRQKQIPAIAGLRLHPAEDAGVQDDNWRTAPQTLRKSPEPFQI
jgi:hypothetical protein